MKVETSKENSVVVFFLVFFSEFRNYFFLKVGSDGNRSL